MLKISIFPCKQIYNTTDLVLLHKLSSAALNLNQINTYLNN